MTVLHLVTQMEAGGAQGAAIRLHQKMLSDGIDSKVVFLYVKRDIYKDIKHVYSLHNKQPTNFLIYFKILFRLFSFFRSHKSFKLICYTHYSNIIGAVIGRLTAARKIIISHRSMTDCYPKIVHYVDYFLGLTGFYDSIICVSNSVSNQFNLHPSSYKERIIVINNGVENKTPSESNEFDWVSDHRYINIVTSGRLHEQKNHMVIFKAILENKRFRFIIAGDGHLKPIYQDFIERNRISERIILLGEISPANVIDFISKGDLFVFPSKTEAFGFSLVEAMSLGLPVIASSIPSLEELTEKKVPLVDPLDEDAWKRSIEYAVLHLEEMAKNSKLVSSKFTFDKMYSEYVKVLD